MGVKGLEFIEQNKKKIPPLINLTSIAFWTFGSSFDIGDLCVAEYDDKTFAMKRKKKKEKLIVYTNKSTVG